MLAVVVLTALFVIVLLWLPDPAVVAHASDDQLQRTSSGVFRRVLSLDSRGHLVVESRKGAEWTVVRHMPATAGELPSFVNLELGGHVTDCRVEEVEPLEISLTVQHRRRGSLDLRVRAALPLADETTEVEEPDSFRRCGGARDQVERVRAEVLAMAHRVGAELEQGLPPPHSPGVTVESVHERLTYEVLPEISEDEYVCDVESRLTLRGKSVGGDGMFVSLEVGQHQSRELSFAGELRFAGAEVPVTLAVGEPEPAVAGRGDRWIYHVRCDLPETPGEFELEVRYEERLQLAPGVRSWYFGAQDFGQQDTLAGGYVAEVTWNTPIELGEDAQWTMPAPSGDLRVVPFNPEAERRYGFRVEVSSSVPRASVFYRVMR